MSPRDIWNAQHVAVRVVWSAAFVLLVILGMVQNGQ